MKDKLGLFNPLEGLKKDFKSIWYTYSATFTNGEEEYIVGWIDL